MSKFSKQEQKAVNDFIREMHFDKKEGKIVNHIFHEIKDAVNHPDDHHRIDHIAHEVDEFNQYHPGRHIELTGDLAPTHDISYNHNSEFNPSHRLADPFHGSDIPQQHWF